jgi:hypothetical protein
MHRVCRQHKVSFPGTFPNFPTTKLLLLLAASALDPDASSKVMLPWPHLPMNRRKICSDIETETCLLWPKTRSFLLFSLYLLIYHTQLYFPSRLVNSSWLPLSATLILSNANIMSVLFTVPS